jgi:hypothetical protein
LKRTAPAEKPIKVPKIGTGCGRLPESKRALDDDADVDAYGSFWSGYESMSLKLSGAESLTFSSTMMW